MANTIISEEHIQLIIGLFQEGKHQEVLKEVDRLVVEYREQRVLEAREDLAFLIQRQAISESNADFAVRYVFSKERTSFQDTKLKQEVTDFLLGRNAQLNEDYKDESAKVNKANTPITTSQLNKTPLLLSKKFWIAIIIILLIIAAWRIGKNDNRTLSNQERYEATQTCRSYDGRVITDSNGKYRDCVIDGYYE